MSRRFGVVAVIACGLWAVSLSAGVPLVGATAPEAKQLTVEANVRSATGYPLAVGEYDTARLNVNLHQRFRSISELCMTFFTSPKDPLAYRDTMAVTDGGATLNHEKFRLSLYNYEAPNRSDTFCEPYTSTRRFLDGKEHLKLWGGRAFGYDNGSATFLRITISVTGTPV